MQSTMEAGLLHLHQKDMQLNWLKMLFKINHQKINLQLHYFVLDFQNKRIHFCKVCKLQQLKHVQESGPDAFSSNHTVQTGSGVINRVGITTTS